MILDACSTDCIRYSQLSSGSEHVSFSKDSLVGEVSYAQDYSLEFLNSLSCSGMPPHELRLRPGTLLILLRNYAPAKGLCNGTRLVVLNVRARLLIVSIVNGPFRGTIEALPRICCDSTGNSELPFILRRHQFPVKLAWAITINKSQGQTIPGRLGIYLPTPVFSHGQLYVAMSRGISFSRVKVVALDYEDKQRGARSDSEIGSVKTLNIVDKALLASTRTIVSQSADPSSSASTKAYPPKQSLRRTEPCPHIVSAPLVASRATLDCSSECVGPRAGGGRPSHSMAKSIESASRMLIEASMLLHLPPDHWDTNKLLAQFTV